MKLKVRSVGQKLWFTIVFLAGPVVFADSENAVSQSVPPDAAAKGAAASQVVLGTLMQKLQAALANGGPVKAAAFCNVELPALLKEIRERLPKNVSFKRTSSRLRNKANAPDELEKQALDYFQTELARTGALPSSLLQAAGEETLRYYKPLVIAPLCLQCHGMQDALGAELQNFLKEKYPDDTATGYSAGDFRGVLRISMPRVAAE